MTYWKIFCQRTGQTGKRVQERSTQTVWQSYRLLFMSRYVTGLLKDAGIDTILLKGSGVAGLYPVPELRKSGDVDLLVENGKMAQEAGRMSAGAWICGRERTSGKSPSYLYEPGRNPFRAAQCISGAV